MVEVSMVGMSWVILGTNITCRVGMLSLVMIINGLDARVHGCEHHVIIIFRVVVVGVRDKTSRCSDCACGRVSDVEAVKTERERCMVNFSVPSLIFLLKFRVVLENLSTLIPILIRMFVRPRSAAKKLA